MGRTSPALRRSIKPILTAGYHIVRPVLRLLRLDRWLKYRYEAAYWRIQWRREGTLANSWYEALFTHLVGLKREDYKGRRILDVGCGPRGTLEWATDAAERVGLDPLVPSYRKLGIGSHAMQYVAAPAESMPFPDSAFDVITSINSLDHVDDLDRTISELGRVAADGGLLLLVVEVDHAPTIAEPHQLGWNLAQRFSGAFVVEHEEHLEFDPDRPGAAASLRGRLPFDHSDPRRRSGTLLLRLRRDTGRTMGSGAVS